MTDRDLIETIKGLNGMYATMLSEIQEIKAVVAGTEYEGLGRRGDMDAEEARYAEYLRLCKLYGEATALTLVYG